MNGPAAVDNDEANSQPHHELYEQMGQLVDRERVLASENDQLRAQLVERKEEEKKRYDDLMVQYYNIKREYEDNIGLDRDGVTMKQEIKEEIKEEDDDDDRLDNQGTSNNQVTVKTESDDEEVKVEIKEEEDHDYDCDQCLAKNELVSDDDDNSMQLDDRVSADEVEQANLNQPIDILSRDQPNSPTHSVFELSLSANCQMQLTNSSQIEQSADQQVDKVDDEPNEPDNHGHNQSPTTKSSTRKRTRKSLTTEASSLENSSTSSPVSTSGPMKRSKRTRVSRELDRTDTVQEVSAAVAVDESGMDEGNGGGEEGVGQSEDDDDETELDEEENGHYKVKIVKLRCTEVGCKDVVASREELNDHLRAKHGSYPFRCLAVGCGEQFEGRNGYGLGKHFRENHSNISSWPCAHCSKTFESHRYLYDHLHYYHYEGEFKCGYDGCDYDLVAKLRFEIRNHQKTAHPKITIYTCQLANCGKSFNRLSTLKVHQQSHTGAKPFACEWTGCGKSFSQMPHLTNHLRIHQKVKPFKCTWNKCHYAATQQCQVIKHIRTQHFHIPATQKKQRELGIEDNRNPHDYLEHQHNPPM